MSERFMSPSSLALAVATVLSLSACSLTPDYQRPTGAVPATLPAYLGATAVAMRRFPCRA